MPTSPNCCEPCPRPSTTPALPLVIMFYTETAVDIEAVIDRSGLIRPLIDLMHRLSFVYLASLHFHTVVWLSIVMVR